MRGFTTLNNVLAIGYAITGARWPIGHMAANGQIVGWGSTLASPHLGGHS